MYIIIFDPLLLMIQFYKWHARHYHEAIRRSRDTGAVKEVFHYGSL